MGVIDGHLQLMGLTPYFRTWPSFLYAMFIRPIQRLFEKGKCSTVVLCFDSYDHVVAYKSMTQRKRMNQRATVSFTSADDLPEEVPQDAMAYISNRSFKLKVIDMICKTLPAIVVRTCLSKGKPGAPPRRFLLDYKRVVEYCSEDVRIPLPVPGTAG